MNVSLTEELRDMVKRKVASGMYASESEVIREALRLLEERDILREAKLVALRKAIQEGLQSGSVGPLDMEDVIRRGRERLARKEGV